MLGVSYEILALPKRAAKIMADNGNSHIRYQRTLLRGCALSGTGVIYMGQLRQFWTGHHLSLQDSTNAGWRNARVVLCINKLLPFRVRAEVMGLRKRSNDKSLNAIFLKSIELFHWPPFVSPNTPFLSFRSRLIQGPPRCLSQKFLKKQSSLSAVEYD